MYKDDERNKCPFFRRYEGNSIVCEGCTGRSSLKHTFYTKQPMEKYVETYCRDDYKSCMIAEMLEKKYQ